MKEALEDLLRYYRREAAGEEEAGRAAEEREVGQVCLAVAETWRRAAGLLEAAIRAADGKSPKRLPLPLTGAQLRRAIERNLPVRVVIGYHDPRERGQDEVCRFEPANIGYYIGDTDIDPADYTDADPVVDDFPEGVFGLYPAPGVDYDHVGEAG